MYSLLRGEISSNSTIAIDIGYFSGPGEKSKKVCKDLYEIVQETNF